MLPIGDAARQSGVTIETIRYYEREGMVPAPDRSASGRRLYDAAGIARLRFIKRCRDLGFSLSVTKTLLELSRENNAACSEVKAVAVRHRAEVHRKITALNELESALGELISGCSVGRKSCPALRTLVGQ